MVQAKNLHRSVPFENISIPGWCQQKISIFHRPRVRAHGRGEESPVSETTEPIPAQSRRLRNELNITLSVIRLLARCRLKLATIPSGAPQSARSFKGDAALDNPASNA